MPQLELENLTKAFDQDYRAVNRVDLKVGDGEFMVLVGPSGCGKSTLLRLIAGLETVTEGRIRISGRDVTTLSPQQRNVAMVFQNYALYPHMSVRDNMAFPLRMQGMDKTAIAERVMDVARMLDMTGMLDKRPAALSGGQRQRAAMGRALVRRPDLFLLDEPLSNLDAALRVQIRAEIAALQKRLGITSIYVTHDQAEAMTLGDRVAVIRNGTVQQVAPPEQLYKHPNNAFVASFIGSPGMNIGLARVESGEQGPRLILGDQVVPLDKPVARRLAEGQRKLLVGLRPEAFSHAPDGESSADLAIEVMDVEYLGHETLVHFSPPSLPASPASGDDVATLVSGVFTARLSPDFRCHAGQTIGLNIDKHQLTLFDINGQVMA